MIRVLNNESSMLYVFRNKETGEYVDENYDPTDDISEAIGYKDYNRAVEALKDFDEPDSWYIVYKLIDITILGEPIEIKQLI